MRTNRAPTVLLAILMAAGLTAACSLNPKEDPTRYYVLSNIVDEPALREAAGLPAGSGVAAPEIDLRVGVGPITFPSYLKRTRMVTRVAENELRFLEADRWGDPLEEAFKYALAVDLSVVVGTSDVIVHPWYTTAKPGYSVLVDVVRFERDPQGTAHLLARWELRDESGSVVAADAFNGEEAGDPTSISSSVHAQSRLVAALSRQIGDAILGAR